MGERICPYCGAYLDPEEKCECREQEKGPAAADQSNAGPNSTLKCYFYMNYCTEERNCQYEQLQKMWLLM